MESVIHSLFLYQWQRKLAALITAALIWFYVNHSITSSKTLSLVPVRVINLPNEQTIPGLLPNGFLSKRATLTLVGARDTIDQLEPGDVEVILDVSNLPADGSVHITKKNLVSLNPNINLGSHVTSVTHPEFFIKLRPLVTEKIPVKIYPPLGEAPKDYIFLDLWPVHFLQTVSGPQEDILKLKNEGLELTFNLNNITKEQLDSLQPADSNDGEVSFLVPEQWKKLQFPFSSHHTELLNDPDAKNLQITFLKEQLLPVKTRLPLSVFYPVKYSASINPETYALAPSPHIQIENHLTLLALPLYVKNVSKPFLDIVKDNMQIDIVAAPLKEREYLEWGVNFIDEAHLENTYVAFLLSHTRWGGSSQIQRSDREKNLRTRFRSYVQNMALYLSPDLKLELQCRLNDGKITVHIPNASFAQETHAH